MVSFLITRSMERVTAELINDEIGENHSIEEEMNVNYSVGFLTNNSSDRDRGNGDVTSDDSSDEDQSSFTEDSNDESLYVENDISSGLNRINLISHFFNEFQESDREFDPTNTIYHNELSRAIELRRLNALRRDISTTSNNSFRRSSTGFSVPKMELPSFRRVKLSVDSYKRIESSLKLFETRFRQFKLPNNPILSCYNTHKFSKWNNFDLDYKFSRFLKRNGNPKKRQYPANGSFKKRKLNNYRNKDIKDISELNPEVNTPITGLLPSSYFKQGSSFNFFRAELLVSKIDYTNRQLELVITGIPLDELLNTHSSFLMSTLHSVPNPKGAVIAEMLQYVTGLAKLQLGLQAKSSFFQYTFKGELIDFKTNDLRLTIDNDPKNLHNIKTKNYKIQNQLLGWLKLNPFFHVKTNLLVKCLRYILNKKGNIVTKCFSIRGLLRTCQIQHHFDLDQGQLEAYDKLCNCLNEFDDSETRTEYYQIRWECRLMYHFIELLTCERYCLTNLLMNFILFRFSYDLNDFSDCYMKYLFDLFPNQTIERKYTQLQTEPSEPITWIGSVDRKFGDLQVAKEYDIRLGYHPERNFRSPFSIGGGDQVYDIL